MVAKLTDQPTIAVIGLGYVGLPLALALSQHYSVTGYDTSKARAAALLAGEDVAGEVSKTELTASPLEITTDSAAIAANALYIITVPTPVDSKNEPDLSVLLAACATVGAAMPEGAVIVIESTVYPGVTRDICGPALEKASGMTAGRQFHLGYSPERINPGDGAHGLASITKVVAGEDTGLTAELARIYGKITQGGIFQAASIETAEAAKVIENAQRDINIAFVNEVALICEKLDLSVHEVLAAAKSKWNFLPFKPGLVGGHCIGVDPFYLAHQAKKVDHQPEVILAGRKINDEMGYRLADIIAARLAKGAKVLVLGLTFKENVRDLRNSKVADLIAGLSVHGLAVDVFDPHADPTEARAMYGLELLTELPVAAAYDGVIPAVPHQDFVALTAQQAGGLMRDGGLIADIKGIWADRRWPANLNYWLF